MLSVDVRADEEMPPFELQVAVLRDMKRMSVDAGEMAKLDEYPRGAIKTLICDQEGEVLVEKHRMSVR